MATVWTILKFLPELLSLIKTIMAMMAEGKAEAEIKASIKQFDLALVKSIATKDTRALEDIFRGKR